MYQQINLYQPIFRKQRQIFSAVTMLQMAGVVAAGLLAVYLYGLWQVAGLEAEVVQLEGREKAFVTQLSSLDPNLTANRRAEVEQELKQLNATLLAQQRLIEVLREKPLGSTDGFSRYLTALGRHNMRELWLTQFTIDGGSGAIELTGRSLDPKLVPKYLQELGREEALVGQRFDGLQIERDTKQPTEVAFRATSKTVDLAAADTARQRR